MGIRAVDCWQHYAREKGQLSNHDKRVFYVPQAWLLMVEIWQRSSFLKQF
jgi:hypothetical protein